MEINSSGIQILEFEKGISDLETKIESLKRLSDEDGINISDEVVKLQSKLEKQIKSIYSKLSPWDKALVARHPSRPHCLDYVTSLIEDFTPLAGDRSFANDEAMISGMGRFRGQSVMVLGQEKGHDVETRIKHNFGMAKPEGYRKAQRLMEMANKFNMPIISFVDTSGAYPGVEAEARGQAEAIAKSIEKCLEVKVPIISVIIGEGGSGGAIAIAAANKVIMLEHSIYSVISPEGCASILYRDGSKAKAAAEALKFTAQDLKELNLIDEIIKEPIGGAHRSRLKTMESVANSIAKNLKEFKSMTGEQIRDSRRDKFIAMGRNI